MTSYRKTPEMPESFVFCAQISAAGVIVGSGAET
jgi:hypothetical protein